MKFLLLLLFCWSNLLGENRTPIPPDPKKGRTNHQRKSSENRTPSIHGNSPIVPSAPPWSDSDQVAISTSHSGWVGSELRKARQRRFESSARLSWVEIPPRHGIYRAFVIR